MAALAGEPPVDFGKPQSEVSPRVYFDASKLRVALSSRRKKSRVEKPGC